jgi:hypothetical protein
MTFYYMQRHNEGNPYSDQHRLSEVYAMDYMGSSEFEWGAYPKAMRLINASLPSFVREELTLTGKTGLHPVTVFYSNKLLVETRFDRKDEGITVHTELEKFALDQLRLHEYSDFPGTTSMARTIAWTDIRHGVFVVLGNELTLEQFSTLVINSIKFYDKDK